MRDYNKGKFLLESKPSQLIMGSGGTASSNTNSQLQPQQKRIVEKVWGAVEKVMNHMRNLLVARLKEPSRSVEEQIKTIE
jgi:exocyst complex component 2